MRYQEARIVSAFLRKADLPAVVGQFLGEVALDDLLTELVQNELDAHSSHTVIAFGASELICEGNGEAITKKGWDRLECILGAGGEVEAKPDGIGAKNHGLRTGFRLGDEILVQSAGLCVRLSLFSEISGKCLDPGVWSREVDPDAPEQGTRVTIPYRRHEVPVPSGEGFILPHIELSEIDCLFFAAVADSPSRFIGAVPVDEPRLYRLTLQRYDGARVLFEFESTPAQRRGRVGRRVCTKISTDGSREVKQREAGVVFPLNYPQMMQVKFRGFSDAAVN
jgi:hypothetical protein